MKKFSKQLIISTASLFLLLGFIGCAGLLSQKFTFTAKVKVKVINDSDKELHFFRVSFDDKYEISKECVLKSGQSIDMESTFTEVIEAKTEPEKGSSLTNLHLYADYVNRDGWVTVSIDGESTANGDVMIPVGTPYYSLSRISKYVEFSKNPQTVEYTMKFVKDPVWDDVCYMLMVCD